MCDSSSEFLERFLASCVVGVFQKAATREHRVLTGLKFAGRFFGLFAHEEQPKVYLTLL